MSLSTIRNTPDLVLPFPNRVEMNYQFSLIRFQDRSILNKIPGTIRVLSGTTMTVRQVRSLLKERFDYTDTQLNAVTCALYRISMTHLHRLRPREVKTAEQSR